MAVDPVSLAITAGLMALQTALTASQKFEGPRLDTLDVSVADPGTTIPRPWGTVRIDGLPYMWAEKLREKKKKSKTKGGKFTEYTYFGTWACLITDIEIDAVSRVWCDKHLCYQMRDRGAISLATLLFGNVPGAPVKIFPGRNFRIYLGTDDQHVDPRIDAWCDDRYGPNTAPAYLRKAYLVFEEIPLEKFGNRIPQVNAEAVRNATDNFPYETKAADIGTNLFSFSRDFGRFVLGDISGGNTYELWDSASQTKLIDRQWPTNAGSFVFGDDGIYAETSTTGIKFTLDGTGVIGITEFLYPVGDPYWAGGNAWYASLTSTTVAQSWSGLVYDVGFKPTRYFTDGDDEAVAVGTTGSTIHFYELVNFLPKIFSVASPTGSSSVPFCLKNADGLWFCMQGTSAFLVDPETETVVDSATGGAAAQRLAFTNHDGTDHIWIQNEWWNILTLEIERTVDFDDWFTGAGATVFDPVTNALLDLQPSSITWLYLDRISGEGVTLGEIVSDVAGWCGIRSINTSALDQIIKGYLVVQGTGSAMLEPLCTAHDSIIRPHDFGLQGIKLGASSVFDRIATPDFAKDGDSPRFSLRIAQDTDLPRQLTINFADQNKDQQVNNVICTRSFDSVDSKRNMSIDMGTYVSDAPEMQKLGDRVLRRKWLEREEPSLALTAQQLALEPGDVQDFLFDTLERTVRLERMTLTAGLIRLECKRDHPSAATLSSGTGAEMDGRDPDTIYVPGPTKGLVLDMPLVTDADDATVPQLYYGAGRYAASLPWPGAIAWRAEPDGEYAAWNDIASSEEMIWGYTTDALPDVPTPWLWDRGNSVNVVVQGGNELTSVTEADINADPSINLAVLRVGATGQVEMFNFATATLELDGSYTLSTLKRGRRGTEGVCGLHAIGDEFALVADLKRDGLGLSDVGVNQAFKVATVVQDPATTSPIEFRPFTGATMKPRAPARIRWDFDGTDLIGTIYRRTRVGGAFTPTSWSVALGETSEAYEIDVMDGVDVLRTIPVSGSNSFTYTAAMASEDGVTLPTPPPVNAYQVSSTVGRGFALAA